MGIKMIMITVISVLIYERFQHQQQHMTGSRAASLDYQSV